MWPSSCNQALKTLTITSLLLTVVSCRSVTGPEFDLADARARWQRLGPASYSLVLNRSCECLPEMSGPVEVSVDNGAIDRRYVGSGDMVPAQYAQLFLDVEGLFAKIEDALRTDAARVGVTYDREYGFPLRFELDQHEQLVDDEVTYVISAFLPQ